MCGVAGYWYFRSGRPAGSAAIRRMLAALHHRGPDESGVFLQGSIALGATRLRVIDPLHGQQPMSNEDDTVVAVFNGEIYNHSDLRRRLAQHGHRFRSRSDTEVLVHAYEEWGVDCVGRFDGMFAFALWNGRADELILARDHVGIKPLYVHEDAEGVTFASELKAILATGRVPVEPDLEAVDDFMTYEYVPGSCSIVQGVRKVGAGTVHCYRRAGAAAPRRFWRPSVAARPASAEIAVEEVRERLRASVRARLVADVPVGAFLSGGLDSTALVALMTREAGDRVRTFSIAFDDPSYDESAHAWRAARRFGTAHRVDLQAAETAHRAALRIAEAFDEPFADVSAFATLRVAELAREDVTVALSGDGGDELFAGYDAYRADRWARRLRHLPGRAPWRLLERALAAIPPSAAKKGPSNIAKRFVEALRRPPDLEHARWWVFWDLEQRKALYSPELRERLEGRDCFEYYRARLREGAEQGFTGLARQSYADITGYLVDDILVKVDRMSMAVSLEARVPYLQPDLIEYALNLPDHWKLRGPVGKWVLREAFRTEIPARIQRRRKQGFSVPLKQWIRGPLRPLMVDLLNERRVRERGWFDGGEVKQLMDEHQRGVANHAHRLWCLAALELSLSALRRWAAPSHSAVEASA